MKKRHRAVWLLFGMCGWLCSASPGAMAGLRHVEPCVQCLMASCPVCEQLPKNEAACQACAEHDCGVCRHVTQQDVDAYGKKTDAESQDLRRTGSQACKASEAGVVGAVRAGVALYRANDLVEHGKPGRYPKTLDRAQNGNAGRTNAFFTIVVHDGIADPAWSKRGNRYVHICGDVTTTYQYNPAHGTFQ